MTIASQSRDEPHPIGDPYFFDLPACIECLEWLMTAPDAERAQFLNGDHGAWWADRVARVLRFVEDRQNR